MVAADDPRGGASAPSAGGDEPPRPGAGKRWQADTVLTALAVVGLAAGGLAWLAGAPALADAWWAATTVVGLVPSLVWIGRALLQRRVGVDAIAVLALAGTLAVGEYLAGALVVVMLTGGRALETRAAARARKDLRLLLARAPGRAHRYEGSTITSPPLSAIRPGDLLVVKPGEVVPVDGRVEHAPAVVDESALTGEAVPAERGPGEAVRSGSVNAGGPFDLRATSTAEDSTYSAVVRLVERAEASSSPFVRLADRYAAAFLPLTLAVAAAAGAAAGDLRRAVAVLVVATPCPLILAAPVAIVSGMSRAARRGVMVKDGASLEALAAGEVLLFDKTGTVTEGRPVVTEVVTGGEWRSSDVLRWAASIDQVSPHVLAGAIVAAARRQGLPLPAPAGVTEQPGSGSRGVVDGHEVAVGKAAWVSKRPTPPWVRSARRRAEVEGSTTVFVARDGHLAGVVLLDDPIRADAARTMRTLRRAGIRRTVMLTGDRVDVAEGVAAALGVDAVLAEQTPADKVEAVELERRRGPTIMVGDGINDAPALARADVGAAMAAQGATIASEAADVVLTVDRFERLGEAIVVARRARRIARQSVVVGMGLSLAAMAVAALGHLPPAAGALLQEGIDVAVILNALRVSFGALPGARLSGDDAELSRRFAAEHRLLRPRLDELRRVADRLGSEPIGATLPALRDLHRFLEEELLPHERAEEAELYPVVARALGGEDPTGPMTRTHLEIARLTRRLSRLVDAASAGEADEVDLVELRRTLYGLHAILRLHFAQEDEGYLSLVDDAGAYPGPATSP